MAVTTIETASAAHTATMQTHATGLVGRMSVSSGVKATRGKATARAHLGAIMRFGVSVLVGVVAVAGVIAFKTAYFLSHFSY